MRLQSAFRAAVTPSGWGAALLVFALGITVAQALMISPVVVELSPARRVVSITMSNAGDQPLRYQAKTLAWTQTEGADQYPASDDLIVVPAIFEIPAAASQIVRVALRHPATGREQAYRLIFQDVTAVTAPSSTGDQVAINIRVDHDLPVNARILAGAWRQWPPELPIGSSGTVRVSAQTRDGVVNAQLSVPGR